MIFASFREPVKTSELEKALNSTLSELGYKILNVSDNYHTKEFLDGKFVPMKEGIEYEVKKGLLGPKIYFGLKFDLRLKGDIRTIFYEEELAKQLYAWTYSLNEDKYESTLLDVLKTTIKKVDNPVNVKIVSYE